VVVVVVNGVPGQAGVVSAQRPRLAPVRSGRHRTFSRKSQDRLETASLFPLLALDDR
jgi:hypothetical protein